MAFSKDKTTMILRELYANATWYDSHTNYNNSIRLELWAKILVIQRDDVAATRTNYSPVSSNTYLIDISPTLQYGPISCSAPGKEAYLDSAFSCFIFQLPYFLDKIQFGYLCGIVIIPIMLISLFGKIKESYRWFLLNQAIWDAFMCYDFICSKPTIVAWSGGGSRKFQTCFYSQTSSNPILDAIFTILRGSFRNAPYIPLLLLAFSRFLAQYFLNFYQRNAKTWKIAALIIGFNFSVMILASAPIIINGILEYIKTAQYEKCFANLCYPEFQNFAKNSSMCYQKTETYFQCYNQNSEYYGKFKVDLRLTQISITPIMFIFVLILVALLIIKVSIQLKYQMKHNRHAFLQTVKVVAVIFVQSISLTIYLLLTGFQTFLSINVLGEFYADTSITKSFSPGIMMLQNFATSTSINILRIFLDSFIVLAVLSGYRKRIFRSFVYVISLMGQILRCQNPKHKIGSATTIITIKGLRKIL